MVRFPFLRPGGRPVSESAKVVGESSVNLPEGDDSGKGENARRYRPARRNIRGEAASLNRVATL